eukprot:scaffold16094_cov80-Skeletonema_marinoi.AAC.1
MAKTAITKLALIACNAATLCSSWQVVEAFSITTSSKFQRGGLPTIPNTKSSLSPSPFRLYQGLENDNNQLDDQSSSATVDTSSSCWNPNLRKTIAAISGLGILETAYLTFDKLQYTSSGGNSASLVTALCSSSQQGSIGSCNDVLHGPYASLHIGSLDIPLSVLGMMAYTMVFSLAIFPVLFNESKDNSSSSAGGNNAVVV